MRSTLPVLAALAIAAPLTAPLAAQQQQVKEKDPTSTVAAAPMPDGWSQRLDDKDAAKTAKFITMGKGFHVTSGGAGIYYSAKDAQANAPFTMMANFRQTAKNVGHGDHGEAFGLFAGGRDLNDADKETYFYFLVRQDGMFLINHRAGKEVHKIVDWTANPAIVKFDDKANAANDLAIKVGADSVRFLVNNQQVHAISRNEISDVSGQAGFRVNHNLDVHVGNFMVMKGM
jgi:hypothetical protein